MQMHASSIVVTHVDQESDIHHTLGSRISHSLSHRAQSLEYVAQAAINIATRYSGNKRSVKSRVPGNMAAVINASPPPHRVRPELRELPQHTIDIEIRSCNSPHHGTSISRHTL